MFVNLDLHLMTKNECSNDIHKRIGIKFMRSEYNSNTNRIGKMEVMLYEKKNGFINGERWNESLC